MAAIRQRLSVRGEVQGVFFRDSTRRRAEELGVAGWASNEPDGSVEIVAEGEPDAVEALIDFCREGPGRADVREVDVTEEEPAGLEGFEVR